MTDKPKKEPLFSLTQSDFEFKASRGTGPGGQARNKTSSKVTCTHKASGASAYSDDTRSQHSNKRDAFEKCVATREFQTWLRIEISRRMGDLARMEAAVDKSLADPRNLRIEGKDEKGRWVPITEEQMQAGDFETTRVIAPGSVEILCPRCDEYRSGDKCETCGTDLKKVLKSHTLDRRD